MIRDTLEAMAYGEMVEGPSLFPKLTDEKVAVVKVRDVPPEFAVSFMGIDLGTHIINNDQSGTLIHQINKEPKGS